MPFRKKLGVGVVSEVILLQRVSLTRGTESEETLSNKKHITRSKKDDDGEYKARMWNVF